MASLVFCHYFSTIWVIEDCVGVRVSIIGIIAMKWDTGIHNIVDEAGSVSQESPTSLHSARDSNQGKKRWQKSWPQKAVLGGGVWSGGGGHRVNGLLGVRLSGELRSSLVRPVKQLLTHASWLGIVTPTNQSFLFLAWC